MEINEKEILILIKNVIKTYEIDSYFFDESINKYRVVYKNNVKEYYINKENVIILKNPVKLDVNLYKFKTKRGKELFNIKEVYLFTEEKHYYYIVLGNGESLRYSEDDIDVKESLLLNKEFSSKIEYLKKISKINDLKNKETGEKLLEKRINKINFFEDSALKTFINKDGISKRDVKTLIFPFGCNNSQYQAVLNAIQNNISVIEGPPGTGKTDLSPEDLDCEYVLNVAKKYLKNYLSVECEDLYSDLGANINNS